MVETFTPPTDRECERCGRHDVWDETTENWQITDTGRIHCIHEWDINGTYNPLRE